MNNFTIKIAVLVGLVFVTGFADYYRANKELNDFNNNQWSYLEEAKKDMPEEVLVAKKEGVVTPPTYRVDARIRGYKTPKTPYVAPYVPPTTTVTPGTSTGLYGLSGDYTLQETGSMSEGSNSSWYLNSGAYFNISGGIGKTIAGTLPDSDRWRLLYNSSNPVDTDNGYRPQNIFRLVTKTKWRNITEEGYFKINNYNLSSSPNRQGHNGILFFGRYKDGDNLYYTGIRVDGLAVVKKKIDGAYYTLASKRVFDGTFNRDTNPNLIPTNQWIGLRNTIRTNESGQVVVSLYMDKTNSGNWQLVLETTDNGTNGRVIDESAYAGIRSDFMDFEVTKFKIIEN